jgi:serine protease AprX
MSQTRKPKSQGRGERHSAAWGKRLIMVVLLLVAETAFAQLPDSNGRMVGKFAPDLASVVARAHQGATANETVDVIVQYKQTPQSEQEGRVQRLGARLNHRLGVVKGIALTIPASALPALEADDEIVSVSVDHPVKALDDYTNAAMNVSAPWNAGYNGTGVGVAVIDSGINDTHPDLWNSNERYSRVVYHQDFTGTSVKNASGQTVYDLYGHGTHVAGIVGGNGYLSNGTYAGVAPNVTLVDLRVLNSLGQGTDSNVISAIQQAINLQNKYNIQVINLSLGRPISVGYAQDPLCQAVESAWKAGIVVVVAAGNYGRISVDGSDGYGTITAPGNDPLVLTVGAMKSMDTFSRTDDRIASYSSKGPTMYDHVVKPDVVAPGNLVVSLDDHGSTLETLFPGNEVAGNRTNHDYFILSGTSMATPAATGAVVLQLQQNPNLTPDQVKARLMKTAYKTFPVSSTATDPTTGQTYTSYYDIFTVGAGYVDTEAAMNNTDLTSSAVGAAASPTAVYNAKTGTVTLSNGASTVAAGSVVWGTSVVWGSSVVWGTNVSGTSVVWGSSVVWGTSTLTGFSVVWGSTSDVADSVVWGAAELSSDAALATIVGEQ